MSKTKPAKNKLLKKIVHLEILLGEQQDSLTERHQNSLVSDCLGKADEILKKAALSFSKGDVESTSHLTNTAWLYINFGRQIMSAEMLESELGESNFFELTATDSSLSANLLHEFERAQSLIIQLLNQIRRKKRL